MSTRHPLRSKGVLASIVGVLSMVAINLGADAAEVESWVQIALEIIAVLVTAGVVVTTGEPEVTPVADPAVEINGQVVPAKLVPVSEPA